MSYPARILFKSLVKPFYKENAGVFIFFFTVMFGIIGKVDGAGLFEYHYSLITGMLRNAGFLILIFFVWFLYFRRNLAFVLNVFDNPQYAFIYTCSCLNKIKQFSLFLAVGVCLLMPVLIYAIFIILIGLRHHYYLPVSVVLVYLLLLCVLAAALFVLKLNNPGKRVVFFWQKLRFVLPASYATILIQFVIYNQKIIWVSIKFFTCILLYLIARNNIASDSDTSFAFLFFNFGILSNSILIFRIRQFEERYINFYRQLPISLVQRFLQYTLFYFIFLVPEFVVLRALAPAHLSCADTTDFGLCAYSLLLLMNSLTFFQNFSMKEYVIILFMIFCVQLIFLLFGTLTFLSLLFFVVAILMFLKGYYDFERSINI